MRKQRAAIVTDGLEIRSAGNGHQLHGYAAVFNSDSHPMGGGRYVEAIAPGAFTRPLCDAPFGRQTLVIDHDPARLIGATNAVHPLLLEQDSRGLATHPDQLPDTQQVRDLRELHDAGLLNGMSFEFVPASNGTQMRDNGRRRVLTDVKLFHVTVLTGKDPAYPATGVEMRALASEVGAALDAMSVMLDAVRAGRSLDSTEHALLIQGAASLAPGEPRTSEAAMAAAGASSTRPPSRSR